ARALEAHHPGRRPGDRVPLRIRDRDHRVVERRIHVGDARRDVLAFLATNPGFFLSHRSQTLRLARASLAPAQKWGSYFFLPAMALAGPLRVRALVCVR